VSTCASLTPTNPGICGTVTDADADFVEAVRAAVSVTLKFAAGRVTGGVYVVGAPLAVDVGDTVPHGTDEQVRVHVTSPPEPVLIVAVNCCVDPGCTVTLAGEMLIGGGGAVTLLLPLPPHPKLATVAPSRVSTPDIRFLKVTRTSLRRTIS